MQEKIQPSPGSSSPFPLRSPWLGPVAGTGTGLHSGETTSALSSWPTPSLVCTKVTVTSVPGGTAPGGDASAVTTMLARTTLTVLRNSQGSSWTGLLSRRPVASAIATQATPL